MGDKFVLAVRAVYVPGGGGIVGPAGGVWLGGVDWALGMRGLQSFAGYLGLALVFVWVGALWDWRSFYFGGGTGGWAIILWGLNFFLIFPNFLRS